MVVGGVTLPRVGLEQIAATTAAGKSTLVNTTLTSLKDPTSGNLILVNPDGTTSQTKDLGSYDILSREVLRLHIPPNVQTTTLEDHSVVVEVYVSTPTGISNKVQIPVQPGAEPSAPGSNAAGYVLAGDTLTIPVSAHLVGTKYTYVIPPAAFASNIMVRVQPINPGMDIPPMIDVTMQFDTPSNNGTVTEKISGIPWDGQAYTIGPAQLTAFATDLVNLLQTNGLIPVPLPAATSPFLTSKSITIETGLPNGSSTTVNQLKIIIQPSLIPGSTSALSPAGGTFAPSATALVATALAGPKTAGGDPASPSTVAQGAPRSSIAFPNPPGAKRRPPDVAGRHRIRRARATGTPPTGAGPPFYPVPSAPDPGAAGPAPDVE